MNKQTVMKIVRQAGLAVRHQGLQPEDVAEAAQLYESGWSLAKIGCDPSNVRSRLIEAGVRTRPRVGS